MTEGQEPMTEKKSDDGEGKVLLRIDRGGDTSNWPTHPQIS
jgi:hypothetical protein